MKIYKLLCMLVFLLISQLFAGMEHSYDLKQFYLMFVEKSGAKWYFANAKNATELWQEYDELFWSGEICNLPHLKTWMEGFEKEIIHGHNFEHNVTRIKYNTMPNEDWNGLFLPPSKLIYLYAFKHYYFCKINSVLKRGSEKDIIRYYFIYLHLFPLANKGYSSFILRDLIRYAPFWNKMPLTQIDCDLDNIAKTISVGYKINQEKVFNDILLIGLLQTINSIYNTEEISIKDTIKFENIIPKFYCEYKINSVKDRKFIIKACAFYEGYPMFEWEYYGEILHDRKNYKKEEKIKKMIDPFLIRKK